MIEKLLLEHLNNELGIPCYMEKPEPITDEFIRIEKIGSANNNYIEMATFAVQSYGTSLLATAKLNSKVKKALKSFITNNQISAVKVLSDYNFTDTTKKLYRYQAVVNITYYERG
jgi:hypothetical protein